MKKTILFFSVLIIGALNINAQAFKLLGQRNFNLNNWALAEAQFAYSESNGNPYLFLHAYDDQAFKKIALIRFNRATSTWEDIIGNNFLLNFGPQISNGKGLADGSCVVVTKKMGISEPNTLYKLDKNGFLQLIGPNPVPTNITMPSDPDANLTVANNGTVYYSESSFFGDMNAIKKWTGNQWVALPSIPEPANNTVNEISLATTDNGEVYVAYTNSIFAPDNTSQNFKKILKLNATETAWETVYTSPFQLSLTVTGGLLYAKNNDVFLLAIGITQGFDTAYKLIH